MLKLNNKNNNKLKGGEIMKNKIIKISLSVFLLVIFLPTNIYAMHLMEEFNLYTTDFYTEQKFEEVEEAPPIPVRITGGIDKYVVVDILDQLKILIIDQYGEHGTEQVSAFLTGMAPSDFVSFVLPIFLDSFGVSNLSNQTTFDSVYVVQGVAPRRSQVYVFILDENHNINQVFDSVGAAQVFSIELPLEQGINTLIFLFEIESDYIVLATSIYRASEDIFGDLLIFTPRLPGIN